MIGAAIRAILVADPTVYALVGERIYPQKLPLDCELPALTYSFPSDVFELVLRSARCQINCWDQDPTIRNSLKDAVEAALKFKTGTYEGERIETIYPLSSYDSYEDNESGFFFLPYDFKVNYYTN